MAAQRYLAGVDLGTSATKAALYRVDGTLVAEAGAEVPIHYPRPGVVEQDSEDFYRTAAVTVRRCVEASGIDPRDVKAIACDSQMAGLGSIDEHFQPAAGFDSWLDMRCRPFIESLDRLHGDLVTRLTGCPPTCDHGPKMLWLQHEQPEQYRNVAKFLMPSAFVAGKMAGLTADRAFIDHTFLHFSALSDGRAGTWSDELVALLGVEREKLPRIVPPWQIVGEVTERSAQDFGLVAGTPIAAGAGDTAAGALGAGVVAAGMLLDTAGTASVLAGCTDRFVADVDHRTLLCMRSVVPGLWHPLAYVGGGGLALRWFRDQFSPGGGSDSGDDRYDRMLAGASAIPPGADGLRFSPHLGGRICPSEPAMRGAWAGFSWGHTRDHFARALLESVAFEYGYYLRILREHIADLSLVEARVIGGGARSHVWNQIKADVLGVPYQRLKRAEFATWGSALIAGYAVGLFDDLATAASATSERQGEAACPRPEITALYAPLAREYSDWQEELSGTFRRWAGS